MESPLKAKLVSRFFASFIDYVLFLLLYWFFVYIFGESKNHFAAW
jgi:hypothetical protein